MTASEMSYDEEQEMYREELLSQLANGQNKRLRLWRFDDLGRARELEFLDVKFEDDEIIVEMGSK